ncbi:MAG: RidA family protein [Actinomycetota bacterium]
MTRTHISTGSPFERDLAYSRAVVDGEWCFVSGTTGYDYASMTMPDGATAQARQALATINQTLHDAGFSIDDVVRARYFITDSAHVDEVAIALREAFDDVRPAATMTITQLVDSAMLVEIEVTARRRRA